MATNYDMLVIGGGTIGLSAAYYAASEGYTTALFEQSTIHNNTGSSKGLERFFRILYSTQARVRLVESSYAMWHEIQNYVGYQLLDPSPLLFFGDPDKQTVEGSIQEIEASMKAMGIPYSYLSSPSAIQADFPAFNANGMPSNYVGLVQESATINVGNSFRAFQQMAAEDDKYVPVDIKTGPQAGQVSQINALTYGANGYYLRTADGSEYTSKYIIMAPGIWLDNVLKFFNLQANAQGSSIWEIWKCTLAFYEKLTTESIPLWYEFASSDDALYYGFPDVGFTSETEGKCKIAADFTYDKYTNVNQINTYPDPKIITDISTRLSTLFQPNTFNIANPTMEEACFYSMAPDYDMVIGQIPRAPSSTQYYSNASMFVMASGRGFKFTPIFGRILVDLATKNGVTPYAGDLTAFSPSRPGLFQTNTDE